MRQILLAAALSLAAALPAAAQTRVVLETTKGEVTIALREDLAPRHAERIRALAEQGFYDGAPFHRVIDGFMAQTGDPTGTGRGGSELPDLEAEFTRTPFVRGSVGMARAADPNSANSQFFIMFDRGPWLDGQYTYVGDVVAGMEVVDRIERGEPVRNPDRIVTMRVAD